MVRNARERERERERGWGCIHHQQDQFIVLFVNCLLEKEISHFVTREGLMQ